MGGGDGVAMNDGSELNTSFAAADGGDGFGVTVNIRMSSGSKFSVKVSLDSTVEAFKSILSQNCDIPAEQQKLIYKGRILKNDQTLQSYGLETDHTVHLVRGFSTAASSNPLSATSAGGQNTTPSMARGISSNEGGAFGQAGLGSSLFPGLGLNGLGSGAGLFGAGLPELEQVQQQLTQNPNLMRDILNMPFVQNLMNNPDVIRNMMTTNPQMRELIDRNPELAHILNDPAILRQTMEAARNPELMREMMRNTDRAMSNIESTPEGFNMLRRMYENVQEPFLNATTTMTGDGRNDLSSNPFAALVGGQVGGPGRDQTVNPTTTNSETAANSPVPAPAPAPNTNPLPNPWASADTGDAQMNTTTRSNATGDASSPPLAGFGSLDFGQMLGSMPDTNSLTQLMQNPAVSQMMQNIFSNPQQMNQIFGLNPYLRNLIESNPQLREMLQNPGLIRQLTSPETFQQLLNFQQVMSQLGRSPSTREPGQNVGGVQGAPDNMGLEMLMNMFSALGTRGLTVPNISNVPPEELYATQLSQLQEMGFFDTQENIRALMATAGNVHAAVERLLGNQGQ